jgi:hypothetical protein
MNLLDKYRIPYFKPEDGGGAGSASSPPAASSSPSSSGASAAAPSSSPPGSSGEAPSSGASPPPQAPGPNGGASESAPPGGEAFDFGSIFGDSEPPSAAPVVQPAATQPAVQPTAPPAPPPVAQQQAPVAAPTTEAAAARTPETATPQAPAVPVLDRYDPGMLASHLAQNEAQALDYVAQNVFKLTPAEVEALEMNVVETIPKLLAKVFVRSQQNVLTQLASMVPVMIQRQSVAMQRNTEGEGKFYQRWPNIKKDQHGDLVTKYGAVYRQMHPNANLDQMIEDLGPMIMMAARIPPQAVVQAPVGQPANPAAQRATNGRSPPPNPFIPAGSVGPAASATAPEVSPWEAMFKQD